MKRKTRALVYLICLISMMSLPNLSILSASAIVPNKIWVEKEEAYGLADGSVEDMQITKALLTARLVVKNDLGLWFHTRAYALAGTPTVYIPDETLSVLELVAPNDSISYVGNFAKEHDKLSVELAIDSLDCTVMNLLNIIVTALPGGIVKPTNLVSILQDVKSIQAVKDAGEALIPFPNSAAQATKATLKAAGHLSKLVSDERQAELLLKALKKVGIENVSLSILKKILVFDTVYELLKIIRDVTVKIIQSPTKNAVISFEAVSQPITTRIDINSMPSGANIFINGESKGKTPASVSIKLRTETPREYKIKLTKEGYKDWEKTFVLKAKEKEEINVKMAPITDLGEIVYLNKVPVPEFFGIYLVKNGELLEMNWVEAEPDQYFKRASSRSNTQTDERPTFVVYFSNKQASQFQIVRLIRPLIRPGIAFMGWEFGDSCEVKRGPVPECPNAYQITPREPLPEGDYAIVYKSIVLFEEFIIAFSDFTVLPRQLLKQKSPAETVKIFLTAAIEGNVSEVRKYASSGFLKEMESRFGSVEKGTKEYSNFEKFEILEEHISSKLAIVKCDFYCKDDTGGEASIPLIRENGNWKVTMWNLL